MIRPMIDDPSGWQIVRAFERSNDRWMRWMRRMEFVVGGSLGFSLASLAFAIYAAFWR